MNSTLTYILNKYNLRTKGEPVEIPGVGRDDLAKLFAELDFKVGAEIGVLQGVYSETLLLENPGVKLFGIDPYLAYKPYEDFRDQTELNQHKQLAHDRLDRYPNYTFIEDTSMNAVGHFRDKSLDFVYIDGNHEFEYVLNDIIQWTKKVRPGGIVAGHDFYKSKRFPSRNHTIFAVIAYTRAYKIRPWFALGRRHAPTGEFREKPRSWFFVKP